MTANEISEAIGLTHQIIDRFVEDFSDEQETDSSFGDWNVRDTLVHITAWLQYSRDVLKAIRAGSEIPNAGDIAAFNRSVYAEAASVSLQDAHDQLHAALTEYDNLMQEFDAADLDRREYQTGFDYESWRYMLLDTVVHPVQHVLYHSLKHRHFKLFAEVLQHSGALMCRYSNDDLSVFDFSEFTDHPRQLQHRFTELSAAINSDEILGDDLLRQVVQRHTDASLDRIIQG
ncbi:MAG: DinB family protein [Spirochaeta sp.]